MATSVSICSNALVMLGQAPFSSFDEAKDHVRAAAVLYPSVRDDILRAHPWNCATKRALLAPLVASPAFGFTRQFQLPGDWLRTLQVGRDRYPLEFRTEGQTILANVDVLPLVYVFANYTESSWSTNLVRLAEMTMAAAMAYTVTASSSLQDSWDAKAMRQLKMAKAVDGQDDPPEEFASGTFLESRFW